MSANRDVLMSIIEAEGEKLMGTVARFFLTLPPSYFLILVLMMNDEGR